LLKFNFIPHSRLDDLMISYAPEGGGVGPHFDSYDVFLLQGVGRRHWQISAQRDRQLVADAPLKILRDFKPEQEWVLEPGDMLYLPPGYAHNGVARDPCMTYSIGFRAPAYQELATQFLVYLQDHSVIKGMYRDPDIGLQPHPGHISAAMMRQASTALGRIKWDHDDMERFMGIYLTEPKPHIFFRPPSDPVSEQEFAHQVTLAGLELGLKSRMLWRKKRIFINGEVYTAGAETRRLLAELADRLVLPAMKNPGNEALALLYQWYLDGYVEPTAGSTLL
ncbi:MAG: cupin domain-containing protein, partial [Betaproteobacteria bacterium]|nr:cupin domain-containing protein [Betaproteobacteria bacterium]